MVHLYSLLWVLETIISHNYIDDNFCLFDCINGSFHLLVVNHVYQLVNYN